MLLHEFINFSLHLVSERLRVGFVIDILFKVFG